MATKNSLTGRFVPARFCINGHDTQITGRNKYSGCLECIKVASRKRGYRKKYGITIDQFDAMLEKQNNCCAICGTHQLKIAKRLAVDHNHTTGTVRGLLCPSCNKNLGILENREFCFKATLYLGGK